LPSKVIRPDSAQQQIQVLRIGRMAVRSRLKGIGGLPVVTTSASGYANIGIADSGIAGQEKPMLTPK
jgi:hypothetical protein